MPLEDEAYEIGCYSASDPKVPEHVLLSPCEAPRAKRGSLHGGYPERMPTEMSRRPNGLKWLVERRAYAAGELLSLQAQAKELRGKIAAVRRRMRQYDAQILTFDSGLQPQDIRAFRPMAVKVTRRGALVSTMMAVLREAAPRTLTTRELATEIARRAGIKFAGARDFARWQHNSVGKQLKKHMARGMVERVERDGNPIWATSRWRLRTATDPSAGRLLEQLVAAGEEVQECDDDRE